MKNPTSRIFKIQKLSQFAVLALFTSSVRAEDALDALTKKYGAATGKAAEAPKSDNSGTSEKKSKKLKKPKAKAGQEKPPTPPAEVKAAGSSAESVVNPGAKGEKVAEASTEAKQDTQPPSDSATAPTPIVDPIVESSKHDVKGTERGETKAAVKSEKVEVKEEAAPKNLLGALGGVRAALESVGASLEIAYKLDLVGNIAGGVERKFGLLGNLDVKSDVDFEKSFGVKGLVLHLYGLGNHGSKPTEFVGDLQGTSNIEAPSTFKLYEAYLRKDFDGKFQVSFGLTDLNSLFYSTPRSGMFRGSAFGVGPTISQTGPNGPSIFPSAAMALVTSYKAESSFYLLNGTFNAVAGDPDRPHGTHVTWKPGQGYLFIVEAGWAKDDGANSYKYSAGTWTYTDRTNVLDSSRDPKKNWGAYFFIDHKLTESLGVFARFGYADPQMNTIGHDFQIGVVSQGPMSGRADDVLGLGLAVAKSGADAVKLNGLLSAESVLELSYRMDFGRGMALTPDFQYVIHPSLVSAVANASVVSLRAEASF